MAMYINNMDELEKALQPAMQKMVDGMANKVYETLNFFLQRYYDSYDPIYYRRQYDFLRSGFKVDARIVRGKVVASVYIDVDYMSNYYGVTGGIFMVNIVKKHCQRNFRLLNLTVLRMK